MNSRRAGRVELGATLAEVGMLQALLLTLVAQTFVPGENAGAMPEGSLFGDAPEPWVAPGRLFSVRVPPGWGIALHDDDPYTIDFRGAQRPGNGVLQIRRLVVPQGAHPRQLMLNAIESRLSKLPNFRVVNKRNVQIAGTRGAAVVGSYSYQGNIQYPVALEEIYVVVGREAFIFHFECFEPFAVELANDVNLFYVSFAARPPGIDGDPFAVPKTDAGGINPDKVRF